MTISPRVYVLLAMILTLFIYEGTSPSVSWKYVELLWSSIQGKILDIFRSSFSTASDINSCAMNSLASSRKINGLE